MSGVLAIYGLIVAVLLVGKLQEKSSDENDSQYSISESDGYRHLSAGLAVGLSCQMGGVSMADFLASVVYGPYARAGGKKRNLLSYLVPLSYNSYHEGSNKQQMMMTSSEEENSNVPVLQDPYEPDLKMFLALPPGRWCSNR